jgi:hypothetical protein
LLTGRGQEPADSLLGKAVVEGVEIPDVRRVLGYGPAKYVTPGEVREIAEVLAHFPSEERVRSFDGKAATESKVYGTGHGAEKFEADEKEALIPCLELLRDFYRIGSATKIV